MSSIQLGGKKKDMMNTIYMPINNSTPINFDLVSESQKRPAPVARVRPSLSSLGSMSSPTSSPPSTPGSPDKLQTKEHPMKQVQQQLKTKLSDADSLQDSAVGSYGEGSLSYHSNDSDTDIITVEDTSPREDEKEMKLSSRVAVYKRGDVAVILKITCGTEAAGSDSRVTSLLIELVDLTVEVFCKNNCDKLNLSTPQVYKLRLKEGCLAKERLSELGRTLGQSLTVSEAVCRRTPENGFVGILVRDTIEQKPFLTISREGVLLVLHKANRFAPAEEFSDQVCEHILANNPRKLGDPKKILKLLLKTKAQHGHAHMPKDKLLSQTFLLDPTLTVLEAAKKCFIEIRDFTLYN